MSEDLIFRKLTADGDHSNDDRRLIHSLFTLYEELDRSPSNTAIVTRIEMQLQQAQLAFDKQLTVAELCVAETTQVKAHINETESLIADLQSRIETVKEELVAAKLVRKNRQEYDAMAKLINERPSRQETQSSLARLERELAELHESQRGLEQQLLDKRKNLYALAVLLNDLDGVSEFINKRHAVDSKNVLQGLVIADEPVSPAEEGEQIESDVDQN